MNYKSTGIHVYHHNDADGYASAWVVKQVHPEAVFTAVDYGDAPPVVTGDTVFVLDFSWPRIATVWMINEATDFTLIDHHRTAAEELADLPGCHVDTSDAGCLLTWRYFYKDAPPPRHLEYIADRDVWRNALPDTLAFTAYVQSIDLVDDFDRLMVTPVDEIIAAGRHINRYRQRLIAATVAAWRGEPRFMEIDGLSCPVANVAPFLASDVGNILSLGYPLAITYSDVGRWRDWELRSASIWPGAVDVSEIAKRRGGGGHKHAAGFRETVNV